MSLMSVTLADSCCFAAMTTKKSRHMVDKGQGRLLINSGEGEHMVDKGLEGREQVHGRQEKGRVPGQQGRGWVWVDKERVVVWSAREWTSQNQQCLMVMGKGLKYDVSYKGYS